MDYSFGESQHFWFEELNPDYFVDIRVQEKGQGLFKPEESLFTEIIRMGAFQQIMERFPEDNIWRSWLIYLDREKATAIGPVPLVFDIDYSLDLYPSEIPENEHLHIVYQATRTCLDILLGNELNLGLSESHLRLIFSGFKGFHIEVKTQQSYSNQQIRALQSALIDTAKRCLNSNAPINYLLEHVVLDPFHEWIRLEGSLYSIQTTNGLKVRKVYQMSVAQFRDLDIHKIIEIAEQF